ncbi:MAG: TlpA family protein disulfide reductase [Planctomycetota bacterium]|jgi:thiol-disulfide isomerase/thioredoxin
MTKTHLLSLATTIAIIMPAAAASAQETPATAPAAEPVPQDVLDELESQFRRPPGGTRQEMIENYMAQMEKAIGLGQEAEKEYPDAPNLHVARSQMLNAAVFLASRKADAASQKLMLDIADRIVSSTAPPLAKLAADFHLTLDKITPRDDDKPSDEEIEKQVKAYAERYAETDAAVEAKMRGVILARSAGHKELADELADELESKHLDHTGVRRLLRQLGREPDAGKPFEAELTRLSGEKLSMPDELKGKVVVVDFWATWCPHCVLELPEMINIYAKYQTKGVEFVGISLDSKRKDLEDFLETRKLPWIITYTGKGWDDPTVQHYEIGGIPSVWVVGKDGKVITERARGRLKKVLDEALE